MLARLLTDPVWYFYQQWFPSYLNTERHVGQSHLTVTWVVFLAADVGTLLGGIASALLMKRSRGPVGARLGAMLACAALVPLSVLIPQAHSLSATIALASVVVLAHLAWLANISALVVDVIPRHLLATCFGIAAAGSALGGIVMNDLVAGMATRHAYGAWFGLTAVLHPVAWLLLWAFCSRPAAENSPIEP
jgi:ACS family hexuronate transporter-like MFS transporter